MSAFKSALLLGSASLLLGLASAASVPTYSSPGTSQNNQQPSSSSSNDCSNIASGPSPACYTSLNAVGYLSSWNTSYDQELCPENSSWADCFLSFALSDDPASPAGLSAAKQTNLDCSFINNTALIPGSDVQTAQRCPVPANSGSNVPGSFKSTPQKYYISLSLEQIQAFVSSWSQALSNSAAAGPAIAKVLQSSSQFPNASNVASAVSSDGAGNALSNTTPPLEDKTNLLLSAIITTYGINSDADTGLKSIVDILSAVPSTPGPYTYDPREPAAFVAQQARIYSSSVSSIAAQATAAAHDNSVLASAQNQDTNPASPQVTTQVYAALAPILQGHLADALSYISNNINAYASVASNGEFAVVPGVGLATAGQLVAKFGQ